MINCQRDIKLGQFDKEEAIEVLSKIENRKLQASAKYPMKYGRQGNLMTYSFDFPTPIINTIQ